MKTKSSIKNHVLLALLLAFVSALFVSAPKLANADTGQWADDVHTVTFITGEGASVIEPQYVEDGRLATRPQDPTRQGYNFVDWYTERYTFSHVFDFKIPIIRDVDVYAKWDKIPEPTPEPTPTPVISSGWYEDGIGWYFIGEDGVRLTNIWAYLNVSPKQEGWYCFDINGYLRVNGWIRNTNRTWSYVDENGRAYAGGWYFIGGYWYYFDGNGTMLTGWIWDDSYNSWFYCDGSGHMIQGRWAQIGDAWYDFYDNGQMVIGWVYSGEYWDIWYYCCDNGKMATNTWEWVGGSWYYFDKNGAMMHSGKATIDGHVYWFYRSGAMVTGWAKVDDISLSTWSVGTDELGNWYDWVFCDSSGIAPSGWYWMNDGWYYFYNGWMDSGWSWISENNAWFYFDRFSGKMLTGWQYLIEYGTSLTGGPIFAYHNGNLTGFWYYFYPDGKLAVNKYIDGYWVDSNGRLW